ncbi:MAG TPA: HipA domain-containing protein [Eoetvoesiella sp.]
MQSLALKQNKIIDVSNWALDAEFAIFPQGARAKEAFFSPHTPTEQAITADKRYLFKRSKKSYPDQFWGEIIAYRIGCLLGLEVPPAFLAWNSSTGICAALIEWFYIDGEEAVVLAGDFLQKLQPNFDRRKGSTHNLRDITILLRALSQRKLLDEHGWKQWWVDALLFDALIGNTDRHQDNWGFLFRRKKESSRPIRLTPLFDNGTSLGHERFTERTAKWSEADFLRYINKGTHHVAWSTDEPRISGHFELLEKALKEWPETKLKAQSRIAYLSQTAILDSLSDLEHLDALLPLTKARLSFVENLLGYRLEILKNVLS